VLLVGCFLFSIFGLADILWGFSTSSLWRTARQHYMTETQHIDTVEERLMHGVVFGTRGGLHLHGASHEIGFIPYQGLDEQSVLFF
jgi:hypothetical protein